MDFDRIHGPTAKRWPCCTRTYSTYEPILTLPVDSIFFMSYRCHWDVCIFTSFCAHLLIEFFSSSSSAILPQHYKLNVFIISRWVMSSSRQRLWTVLYESLASIATTAGLRAYFFSLRAQYCQLVGRFFRACSVIQDSIWDKNDRYNKDCTISTIRDRDLFRVEN